MLTLFLGSRGIGIRSMARVLMGVLLVAFLGVLPGYAVSNLPAQSPQARSPGQIGFETFRLLSSGMTEAEVLQLAGPPAQTSYRSCHLFHPVRGGSWKCLVYYYDGWVVGVGIDSGRVQSVVSFRLP